MVRFGGHEYVARALPIGQLRALARELAAELGRLATSPDETTEQAVEHLLSSGVETLDRFLRAFVPELPAGLLEDPENGPTLPEIVEAVQVIAKLNRFDTLAGLVGPFGRVLQTAASRSNG